MHKCCACARKPAVHDPLQLWLQLCEPKIYAYLAQATCVWACLGKCVCVCVCVRMCVECRCVGGMPSHPHPAAPSLPVRKGQTPRTPQTPYTPGLQPKAGKPVSSLSP